MFFMSNSGVIEKKCIKGLGAYEDIEILFLVGILEMDRLFCKVLHKSFHSEIPDFLGRER